jgi:hypothetical protein
MIDGVKVTGIRNMTFGDSGYRITSVTIPNRVTSMEPAKKQKIRIPCDAK